MKFFISIIIVLWMPLPIFAEGNCVQKCSQGSSECFRLGIRARWAALHLKEMFELGAPATVWGDWTPSECDRSLSTDGLTVSSSGRDCVERMIPVPKPIVETSGFFVESQFEGTYLAQVTHQLQRKTLIFQGRAPTFSAVFNGKVWFDSEIQYLTWILNPDLLVIATGDFCYAIE